MFTKRWIIFLVLWVGISLAISGCAAASGETEAGLSPVTSEPAALSPAQVAEAFYGWYLESIGDPGSEEFSNPLVSGVYRESEYLTGSFVAQVDETIAGFDQGGYDPVLLAQDIPVRIEVQEPALNEAEATVVVLRYWGGNPEPSPIVVHLVQQGDRWLIDNVTPFETVQTGEPAAAQTPEDAVAAFYGWYLDYIGDPATGEFRNPLVDRAYRDAPYLTDSFVGHVDELLDSFQSEAGGSGYDPFLCAQAIPTEIGPEVTFERNGMATVVVSSSFPNHRLAVDLRLEDQGWLIGNITCASDPAGVTSVFYSWYLGYIGDRQSREFRNPLSDKAYREFPLLDEAFVAEVDALLEGFEQGGYDPFLLAQDIPQDFSVDPGVEAGTAVAHLQFGPDNVRHLLVIMDETGRRIRAISEAETPPASGPESAEAEASAESWSTTVLVNEEYGFSFAYPEGWVLEPQQLGGPGMPEDWPVEALWLLMDAETAEALAASSGPPDPNAPVIVAPFNVEVVVGDEAAMERVYWNFPDGEKITIAGLEAIVMRSDPGITQTAIAHPLRADTWIIFTDWVSGFPGRETQAEAAGGIWEPMLNSLHFFG